MRDLALSLARAGNDVTYLTMRHWEPADEPQLEGVRIVGLVPPGRVYQEERRSLGPPLRFGVAVARHLWSHGRSYDVVNTASFPYFPVLAAAWTRRRGRFKLVVTWFEIWTKDYWKRYAGTIVGTVGWRVQRACVRVPQTAFCISQMHATRLVDEGFRGTPIVLPGLYAGDVEPTPADHVDPNLVVYAGRHVREKRIDALVEGLAVARTRRPDLRLELFGDGPERPRLESLAVRLGVERAVVFHGRRPEDEVAAAIARAACLATASEREGYGLIVVEAAARGTPSVVVAGSENAAFELVKEGINGAVAADPSPSQIADAVLSTLDGGDGLRSSTVSWFHQNAASLRIDRSIDLVAETIGCLRPGKSDRDS
jgi:glycosyltransferase involved in cell wall biosynthesis